ncbi:hypothetical protein CNX65_32095 [Actinosynnema pretiosum]|uniref:Uncharacterized protein n=1 Tax=Actinosynnema pretiosum TaxID=42197 RepID=A0A290ZEE1_9PSEU|nr:hypothetical protein CNX65_32095 [Actinosynnema pretiosum]
MDPELRDAAFGARPDVEVWRALRGSPADAWLAAVVLGAQGHYAAASAALTSLVHRPRPDLFTSLAASALASHHRQLGDHRTARRFDSLALSTAPAPALFAHDPDGIDPLGARADALLGLAADAIGAGNLTEARRLHAAALQLPDRPENPPATSATAVPAATATAGRGTVARAAAGQGPAGRVPAGSTAAEPVPAGRVPTGLAAVEPASTGPAPACSTATGPARTGGAAAVHAAPAAAVPPAAARAARAATPAGPSAAAVPPAAHAVLPGGPSATAAPAAPPVEPPPAAHSWRTLVRHHWIAAEIALASGAPADAVPHGEAALALARARGGTRHILKSRLVLGTALVVWATPESVHRGTELLVCDLNHTARLLLFSLSWPTALVLATNSPVRTTAERHDDLDRAANALSCVLLRSTPASRRAAEASPWMPTALLRSGEPPNADPETKFLTD